MQALADVRRRKNENVSGNRGGNRGGSNQDAKVFLAAPNKGSMLNDLMNTGVMAAVIGGFALSNLQSFPKDATTIDVVIYMINVVAVHMNTCSSLCSALLYMCVNNLVEEKVEAWKQKIPWKILLLFPTPKFVIGTAFYLIGVLLLSWRDLGGHGGWRIGALIFGTMTVIMVFMTASIVTWGLLGPQQKDKDDDVENAEAGSKKSGGLTFVKGKESKIGAETHEERKDVDGNV